MIDVEHLLRQERAIVATGLATLALLAWAYVWQGAGMGTSALAMTRLALFPHLQHEAMAQMAAPHFGFALVVAMWWVMMIAMMVPSAAPFVLLYARVLRHASASGSSGYASAALLVAGYLAAWLGFSVAAALAQQLLQMAGLISPGMLWSRSAPLSAAVLAAAGLYQLSRFKGACLRQCRGPMGFLTQHWRPGWFGALRMGPRNGAIRRLLLDPDGPALRRRRDERRVDRRAHGFGARREGGTGRRSDRKDRGRGPSSVGGRHAAHVTMSTARTPHHARWWR